MKLMERAERNSANLARMADRILEGQPLTTRPGEDWARVARRCQNCSATEACEHWLESTDPRDRQAPGFCPNAESVWSQFAAEPGVR